MRNFGLGDTFIFILVILVAIVLSPIWIPFYVYVRVRKLIVEFRFSRFVRANDGAKYFCYTLRRNSEEFVRSNILPRLPAETNIIYITDNHQNLGDSLKFVEQVVRRMGAMKKGFPCVAKFSDGKLLTESINHEVYQAIVRKKDADKLVEKIEPFYAPETF